MYSDIFCKVYNEFGWNYYPEAFGQQLLRWLEQHGIQPKSAMDLACGTGVLCRILQAAGIQASGMDLSQGMIRVARENSTGIPYTVADMTTFCPDTQYDLVTCTGDAVNHIGQLRDVETIFSNVFAYTAPGGWFIFDLLSENEVSESDPFEMDFDETTRVWFQMTRPGVNQVNLEIRVFENNILQFTENIRETIHEPAAICELLCRCGFEVVKCSDTLADDSENHGTTWFLIARKPEVNQ